MAEVAEVTIGPSTGEGLSKPSPAPLRVGLFVDTALPLGRALLEGIKATGDKVAARNPQFWRPGEFERFDAAIFQGIPPHSEAAVARYLEEEIPTYFVELGHIHRATNPRKDHDHYYQFGLGGLNSLPPGPCPDDRRLALGIEKPEAYRNKEGHILLLGQKPDDAQHNIRDWVAWKREKVELIQSYTERPIRWRKHPRDFNPLDPPPTTTLEEDFAGAWAVVTHNSNAGLKALMRGLAVVCHPFCYYAPLSQKIEDLEKPKPILKREWEALFNRICYAQWTPQEFATGYPWRRAKECYSQS